MNGQNQIFEAVKALIGGDPASYGGYLSKAWNQPTSAIQGINYYDLEAPAKQLYPVITPLRNRIPRVKATGGIQANWRAVTAINTGGVRAGVSGGNRGGVIATTVQNYIAAFAGIGLEDYVTFEADLAANGFQDVKALAVTGLLNSLMIQEESIILGGNTSLALGTPTAPTLVAGTAGNMATAAAASVIVVGLTLDGFLNSSLAGGIPGQVTRVNADGSTDLFGGGSSNKSAGTTVSVTGPNGSIAATVPLQNGAVAYAWFAGATAGTERLSAITTINSAVLVNYGPGNQLLSAVPNGAADNSQNLLVFDGLLTMCQNSTYGSLVQSQPTGTAGTGAPLTSDNAGGILEIDAILKFLWDNFRLSPTDIYLSSQEMTNIGKKILAGNSSAAQRFSFLVNDQGVLAGGVMVRSYLNKYTMNGAAEIPIHLHPNMPPGTIMFYTDKLPYPLSNVAQVLRILTRREYYQIEWPLKTRKYEYGVYADEVLQNYFPPSFAILNNIGNG